MIMKRMEADMEQTERFKEMQRRMEPIDAAIPVQMVEIAGWTSCMVS